MILDVVYEPRLFGGESDVLAYVIAAIIIVCAVIITIKLINKKKKNEDEKGNYFFNIIFLTYICFC